MYYNRNQVPLYLRRIKAILKCCIVSFYHHCLNNLFFSLRLSKCFRFLKQPCFLSKMKVLSKKTPPTKVEGFQMSSFDLSQICQIAFTENFYIWNFSVTLSVYICVENFRETLKL